MKHYFVCKKRFNIFFLVFLGFFFIFPLIFSRAQTTTDLQNQINQKNQAITQLEAEIAGYQTQLDTLGQQKSSLNESIQTLNVTQKQLAASIAVTQNKIDKENLQIKSLSSQIGVKKNNIANNMSAIALEIRQTNEIETGNTVETILSEDSFTKIWNDLENLSSITDSIKKDINALQQAKSDLETTKTQTIAAQKELLALKSQLADQKKIVDQNAADKKKLLAQTKNSEANYQKLLQTKLAQKVAFQQEILDYESRLKYTLNPSALPSKGILSWPLDSIYITNPFGKNTSGIYSNNWHNGTDFRATIGTRVLAMADGIVAGTGDTDLQCPGVSFGRFELIKYNDGLASTFGHLSLIIVKAGDTVTRGEVVGYSGKTGYATGPHLHVSIYPRDAVNLQTLPAKGACVGLPLTQPIAPINAYLDPMYYLPPYKG